MNKLLGIFVLGIMLLSMISATSEVVSTKITGFIYQNNNISDVVSGADVTVTCLHSESESTQNIQSNNMGIYTVIFNGYSCTFGDVVNFYATDGTKYGSRTVTLGETCEGEDESCLDPNHSGTMNIAVVDVPLVPEFGVFAGALTLLSAVGIFFFVRKK